MDMTLTAKNRGSQETNDKKPRNIALAVFRGAAQRLAMPRSNALLAAVKVFMAKNGLKPTPWAQEAGVNESTFRSFLEGKAQSPRYDTLQKLAAAADATVAEMVGEKLRQPKGAKDAIAIKSLEVRASTGGGFHVTEEPEGPPFYFRREWIERLLDNRPGRLRVHWFEGNSMQPTINSGDVGLIHLEHAAGPGIYTLWDGHGLITKRIEPISEDTLRITSDNPQWPPREVGVDEVKIVGRVLWRGGVL